MNGMAMLNDALKGLAEHIDSYEAAAKNRVKRQGTLKRTPADRKYDVVSGRSKQLAAARAGKNVVPLKPKPPPAAPAVRMTASIQGDDLMKALSNADTVLGHTHSGKPVKVHGKYHGRFDADDHDDAADMHGDLADRFSRMASRYGQDKAPPAQRRVFEQHAKHHRIMAAKHRECREGCLRNQNKEKGTLYGGSEAVSATPMSKEKSPLFDKGAMIADLSKAIRGAVSKSVAAMRYERSMTCPIHANGQAAVHAGIAGSHVDLRATHCRCNDSFAKSAVAERTMDTLRKHAEALAVAKELGIPLSVEWVEQALGTDDEE